MKKVFTGVLIFLLSAAVFAQSVPVTFHFKPDYKQFTALRLTGSFNNWNNADDKLLMTDPDGDGEYEVTVALAPGVDHNYKFVMDANWSFAYSDPDNPRINAADNNNSTIFVKDPMITYLTPRDINTKDEKFIDVTPAGMPVRAVFAFTDANPMDLTKLVVKIDGVALQNPAQYYNAAKKEFLYQPQPALSVGQHTVTVSVGSAAGTDEKSATFIRDPNYVAYKIPVDFYYDQYNKTVTFSQTLTGVSLVGIFNNWNDSFNPMQDSNGDGLWEATAIMDPGPNEYKFKLNKIYWTNDPDWPVTGETVDNNSMIMVRADSQAVIKLIEPLENTTFRNDTTVTFRALLRPGVKSKGVDKASILLKVDGAAVPAVFDTVSSAVTADVNISGSGRHVLDMYFKNKEGVSASQNYSYGIYKPLKGRYVVDGASDEPYSYPAGVPQGSADILSVTITETPQHDSLHFAVQLKDISDRTRIGLIISNPSNTLVSDPRALDIRIPEWSGQGVFASIGAPGNSYENAAVENRFMTSSNPAKYSAKNINVNSNAAAADKFTFDIALSFLDSLMGSWSQQRQIFVFSYLAAEDKSGNGFEVGTAEGGISAEPDPDIYDAAFMRSNFWQKRMLANYIPAGEKNGPRFVALDGRGRGILPLASSEISDSLAHFGTDITFLTPGVEYTHPELTVYGHLSDTTIHTITFVLNNVSKDYAAPGGKFAVPVTLIEGANSIFVKAEDSKGFKSTSRELVITYKPYKIPDVYISGSVVNRQVTLVAEVTSPIGASVISYSWFGDAKNPESFALTSTTNSVTFELPKTNGEYIFGVTIRDSKGNRAFAKTMVVAEGDSVYAVGIDHHANWIDDAIVYEIYPRSFSQQGGFQGVTDNINYLKELGINTIWFMPVYKGPTIHGYEITDYYGIEEDYGTEKEFKTMLTTLKLNNIRVILDYVVNHTSVLHPFMQNVMQYRGYSPWADFYLWEGEPGNSNYKYYFDWTSLPNLNHNNPDVRKYFIEAAKYWVNTYAIDGYRCDVAWGVEERNTQFWQEWRKALKAVKPDIFLEAEATSSNPVFYQRRFDTANDWDLRTRILDALNGTSSLQDLHKEVIRSYTQYARPFRFIENHDESRAASLFDTKRSVMMHKMIFTMNGIPLIYSGGEVGETTKREMINWNDPEHMTGTFKRMIYMRKLFVHNPVIGFISNSDNNNVYSYSSTSQVSGKQEILITAANFRKTAKDVVLDLSKLPFDGTSTYHLTDVYNGQVYTVEPGKRDSVLIPLKDFDTRVFYYSTDILLVSVEDKETTDLLPKENRLYQNYPNPFNPTSVIRYQIKDAGMVSLKVYDILGKEVSTLVDEVKNAGTYEVTFNGAGLSSGVYFYQLRSGAYTSTQKFILMK